MKIRNWEKFQHYSPKNPKYKKQMTWFKLYGGDILNDLEWFELSDTHKAINIELLCLASQHEGNLPDIKKIVFRLRRPEDQIQQAIEALGHWLVDGVYTESIPEKSIVEQSIEEKYDFSLFDKFWEEVIPKVRKYAKQQCKDKWKRHDLNKEADKIFAWYEGMKKTEQFKKGMVPAPEVVINQRQWESEVPKEKFSKVKYDWEGAK